MNINLLDSFWRLSNERAVTNYWTPQESFSFGLPSLRSILAERSDTKEWLVNLFGATLINASLASRQANLSSVALPVFHSRALLADNSCPTYRGRRGPIDEDGPPPIRPASESTGWGRAPGRLLGGVVCSWAVPLTLASLAAGSRPTGPVGATSFVG